MSDTPQTDNVWAAQKFDSHMQCVNACNALLKHARAIERQRNEALRALAVARDYVGDISLMSTDGVTDRPTVVRMIDLAITNAAK